MTRKNEQRNLFKDLNLARDKHLLNQEVNKSIYKEIDEALAEDERKIKLFYQERINILKEKLENYRKLLECYSTFDSKIIGIIIEKIVSLIEGEEYTYHEIVNKSYERKAINSSSESFELNDRKKLIIIKGNYEYFYEYELSLMLKKGNAILLANDKNNSDEKVTFYSVNEGLIQCLVDFNKFSYLKDFIDLVINYRFNNNLEEISLTVLLGLMNEFICSQQELIEKNFKRRNLEKQEQLGQQIIYEQLEFDKKEQMGLRKHNMD